jgi:hypothetical protein
MFPILFLNCFDTKNVVSRNVDGLQILHVDKGQGLNADEFNITEHQAGQVGEKDFCK